MNVFAAKESGCFYRGDEITFNVFLHNSDSGTRWAIPTGSTIVVGMPGDNTPIVSSQVVYDTNGALTVTFPASSTLLIKVGQPAIVVVVTKEDAAWTFEVKAPFSIKSRALII